jgi:hypothetical protein
MSRLWSLAAIEVFVWLGLLLSTFLVSKVAFTIEFGFTTMVERIATQIVRAVVAGVIVFVWLFAWKKLTNLYFWRAIGRRKASA